MSCQCFRKFNPLFFSCLSILPCLVFISYLMILFIVLSCLLFATLSCQSFIFCLLILFIVLSVLYLLSHETLPCLVSALSLVSWYFSLSLEIYSSWQRFVSCLSLPSYAFPSLLHFFAVKIISYEGRCSWHPWRCLFQIIQIGFISSDIGFTNFKESFLKIVFLVPFLELLIMAIADTQKLVHPLFSLNHR